MLYPWVNILEMPHCYPPVPVSVRAEFGSSRERSKQLTWVPAGGLLHHLFPAVTMATRGSNWHGEKGAHGCVRAPRGHVSELTEGPVHINTPGKPLGNL